MVAIRNYALSLGVNLQDVDAPTSPTSTLLDIPVRPLGVDLTLPADPILGTTFSAIIEGDTHFPNQDDDALSIVDQIAAALQPELYVHIGDMQDCYKLSRFDKNPKRRETLQDEINMGRRHLAHKRVILPNSKMVYLEGNHEDRLRRTLWNLKGEVEALASLTDFQETMTWPKLLKLDELGVTFVPYMGSEQARQTFLPKWILKHGTIVRKNSAYTARGEWEKYGRSGSSGHTHRLGMYFHNDHNGSHCWVETGCTCILTPEYVSDPNWQQGCVVLTFDRETAAFQAEPVFIRNGLAVFRGNVYRA
jgi:hypothetical protein